MGLSDPSSFALGATKVVKLKNPRRSGGLDGEVYLSMALSSAFTRRASSPRQVVALERK